MLQRLLRPGAGCSKSYRQRCAHSLPCTTRKERHQALSPDGIRALVLTAPPLPRSVKNSFRSPKGQFPRSSRPKSLKNHFHFESQGSKAVSASSLRRGQEARGHFPPHPSLPSSSPFPPAVFPSSKAPSRVFGKARAPHPARVTCGGCTAPYLFD